ncbi:transposase InsO family protein [Pararhizobium capsulatum DSM 1112]|uniref:Transposase InsO family protein n=1 Tax=Pararhizobium capsulatum DSM 1112 TaxID=1121113 RepID=A0ABU0C2X3_9HYPH|nr:transposase InsO family protein [Pararhizobium capsulatum DSM 1112]
MTSIPKEDVVRARGFVGCIYSKRWAGASRVVSPYDGAQAAIDAYPEASTDRNAARVDVFDYIERYYNPNRRHSTLGYLSPNDFETKVGLA